MAAKVTMQRSGGLEELENKLGDLSPLMETIADFFVSAVVLGFNQSIDPYLDPWEPNTAERIEEKGSGRPLIDWENLMGSASSEFDSRSASVGLGAPYARYHQEGTEFISIRLMIPTTERGLPPDWQDEVSATVEDYLGGSAFNFSISGA